MKCLNHTKQSALLLKNNKLKSTEARLALLDIFTHAKKPLSVGELFTLLKHEKTDKVTLYRNVEALAELGILKKIRLKDVQAYYELVEQKHHHHLICKHCGKIKDIAACNLDTVKKTVLKTTGFASINEHSLEFFGICASCVKG